MLMGLIHDQLASHMTFITGHLTALASKTSLAILIVAAAEQVSFLH